MNTSTSKTLLMIQGERGVSGSNFKSSRPTSKYKNRTEVFKVGSERKQHSLVKTNSQNLLVKPSQKKVEQQPNQFGIIQNGHYVQFSAQQPPDLSGMPQSPSGDPNQFVPFQPEEQIKIQD